MSDRVVIFVRGTQAEVNQQLEHCQRLCEEHGYVVVAIAEAITGQRDAYSAWEDAHRMVQDGEADRIIVASGVNVPVLESATGSFPAVELQHRRPGQRRIRPVARGAEA